MRVSKYYTVSIYIKIIFKQKIINLLLLEVIILLIIYNAFLQIFVIFIIIIL